MAKSSKSSDDKTLELIAEVNRRKAEIAKLEKPTWLTNRTFSYSEGRVSDNISLAVESNVKNLISMAAFLRGKEEDYVKVAAELGVEDVPEFTWQGFSVTDWFKDLQTRINQVQIASKKKKLETLEERLNRVVSPELRAKLELDAISKELENA